MKIVSSVKKLFGNAVRRLAYMEEEFNEGFDENGIISELKNQTSQIEMLLQKEIKKNNESGNKIIKRSRKL